jgi:mono/diheme cytochrome c family protein
MPMRFFITFTLFVRFADVALAVEPVDAAVDFVRDIQPVLQRHCVKCHGPEKQESGLRLDSAAGFSLGGDSGPLVTPDQVAQSRLLIAITGGSDEVTKMPPEGEMLAASDIARLKAWVEQGAKLPATDRTTKTTTDHWSFRPLRLPRLPNVGDSTWVRNPIDYFILARLDQAELKPSPVAEKATLIRRLYLDLIGVVPAPQEVADFVANEQPNAYEQLVERLLSSPAYGERWGRHWLDAARYADSNGYTRDFGREIWKYRDWVIDAINADMPFDQFTVEQFAGDLLPTPTLEQRIATGFHRNTLINEEGGTDQEQFRIDAVADRLATTGEVFLGLTVGCARCHTHKYDPISQREYYQLFAFLNNCDEPAIEAPSEFQVTSGELARRDEIRGQITELEKKVELQRVELERKQQEWEKTVTPQQRARLPGPVQVAFDMAFEKRDAANKKTIEDHYRQTPEGRKDFPLLDEIAKLREIEPKIPKTMVMAERPVARHTHIQRRGDFLDLGDEVQPAVLAVLHRLPESINQPNRLDFARWLVDPSNPLTPRVIANRHWQYFFGHAIVETENDFGTQGSLPTHPELLDWLAVELVQSPWSIKQFHRLIVTSATYRQSSSHRLDIAEFDPNNKLLARQNRLRLEAEIVRDAALSASGLMTNRVGGPSVFPPQPEGVFEFTQDPKPWPTATTADRYRRGMYTHFWRSSPYPALMVFDAPNGNVSCTRRLRSNTPLQALTLANDVQFVECAQAAAQRVITESSADPEKQAVYAFQLCMARRPTAAELQRLSGLYQQQLTAFSSKPESAKQLIGAAGTQPSAELASWTAVCRVLLNLDEFITRE